MKIDSSSSDSSGFDLPIAFLRFLRRRSNYIAIPALVTSMVSTSEAAPVIWDGGASSVFWSDLQNWNPNGLPTNADGPVFGTNVPLGGVIHLDSTRTISDLAVNANGYTIGAYGNTTATLTNTSGNFAISGGNFATINSTILGTNVAFNGTSGGGTFFLNSTLNLFTGNVAVDGASTRLMVLASGPLAGLNDHGNFGRSDQLSLGLSAPARTVTLSNGGEYKLIGGSWNPDGTTKNFVIGAGGGAINVAAARQAMTFDDAGQLTATGAFTKNGNGVLRFASTDYNAAATSVTVNGGWLQFNRQAGGTAGARISTFGGVGATPFTVNNGGRLNINVDGILDQNVTLNNGGALVVSGADRTFGAAAGGQTFTFNGGIIAGFDGFGPGTTRNPRFNGIVSGAGTVDILGSYAVSGVPSRAGVAVFQRADAASNFSGTFVIHGQGAIEINPRNTASIGGATTVIGNNNGTIDLRGYNAWLDLRDSFATNNSNLTGHNTVDLRLSATDVGAISHVDVGRSDAATGTGQVFEMDRLLLAGSQRMAHRNNNDYGLRMSGGLTFSGATASTFTYESNNNSKLEINGTINENVSGDGIIRIGSTSNNNNNAGGLNFTGAVNLRSVNISSGQVQLFGANGSINPGSMSGAAAIEINGNSGNSTTAGNLTLNNNRASTGTGGVAAADNTNRVADSVGVTMKSNSSLSLISLNNTASSETIGTLTVDGGFATLTSTQTGTAAAGTGLTINTLNLNNNAVLNLAGTTLGTTAGSGKIFVPGTPTTTAGSIHGVQYVTGNDWAVYGANGFTVVPTATYVAYTSGAMGHVKPTVAAINVASGDSVQTLNLQFAAGNLNTNGNLLHVVDGGIIVGTGTQIISGGATGGLTSGNSTGPATDSKLFITNSSQLDITAKLANNGSGGAMTLVKSGVGTLILKNQAVPGHTNSFTGGVIINSGTLDVWRGSYLNSNTVTLNGGVFSLNESTAGTNKNTNAVLNFANNVVVNANSAILWDNNAERADGVAGTNNLFDMGSLTVNGTNTWVGVGGYNGVDVRFNGTTLAGTPVFNLGQARGTDTAMILNGVTSGTGFALEATGATASNLVLGGGATDTSANTYSGVLNLNTSNATTRAKLRLDKASGTDAVTGDIYINGGALYWGGIAATYNGADSFGDKGQWNGVSAIDGASASSGMNQIADSANITMVAGEIGENNRYNTEKWATLNQIGGQVNVGYGTMEVTTHTMTGGALNFGANGGNGGVFRAGTMSVANVTSVNIQNNFPTTVSRLEVGSGGLSLKGASIIVGEADGNDYRRFGGGAVLKLGGDVTYVIDSLNTNGANRGIVVGPNREQARNILDLDGGVRSFNIQDGADFGISTIIANGGITKTGGGQLSIRNYLPNTFTGLVNINDGVLVAGSRTALGTGDVTVANGGTLKTDGSSTFTNKLTLSGNGALISNGDGVRELGALVNDYGRLRLTGTVGISGGATIATNAHQASAAVAGSEVGIGGADSSQVDIMSRGLTEITGSLGGTGDLTLTGNGNGIILGGVNTTSGGLIKHGAGQWTLGNGTYAGATEIQAGILRTTGAASLGSSAAGTTVYGGATLRLAGGFNSAETLTLRGAGASSVLGALQSQASNTVSGLITVPTAIGAMIRSDVGTLTLSGGASLGNTLTFTGLGNGILAAVTGSVASGDALVSNSQGSWTLSGANSFTGGTRVNAGLLSANNLHATSDLTLGGGSFTATSAQTVARLNLAAGGGTVNGVGALTLTNALVRTAGATVNFAGSVDATSSPNNASGILGGFATYGTDWAVGAGVITGTSTYSALTNASGTLGANQHGLYNYDSNGFANATHNAAISGATLKIASSLQGLNTGANAVTLSSGGLMTTGTGVFSLGGTGIVGAGAANELNIHTLNGGSAYISSPLIGAGAGSLNKAGNGELRLFGASSFTGSININGGTLSIVGPVAHPGALGASTTTNRTINVNGGTFSLFSGDYDLNDYDVGTAGTQSMRVVVGAAGGTVHSGNGNLLFNDAGQFSGTGHLLKTGGGQLSLDGAYNYAGDVTVSEGTLRIGNTDALTNVANAKLSLQSGTALISSNTGNSVFRRDLSMDGATLRVQGGGSRQFDGTTTFTGVNRIVNQDADTAQARGAAIVFAGPMTGSGTIDVISPTGATTNFVGIGDWTGTVNLGTNARVDFRQPGSLGGVSGAPINVNIAGVNSFLVLRNYQTNLYNMNVTATQDFRVDLNTIGFQQGNNHLVGINNLTFTGNRQISVEGANGYWLDVTGTATAGGDLRKVGAQNLRLTNGITGVANLNLDGGFTKIMAPTTTTGATIVNSGTLELAATGTLTSTRIDLRGGEFIINGGEGAQANRINSTALNLGGGTFETNEATNLGNVTLNAGTTRINYSNPSQSVSTPLVLTGFTKQTGAIMTLGSRQGVIGSTFTSYGNNLNGNLMSGTSGADVRWAGPKVHIAGQADIYGTGAIGSVNIIPWAVYDNEFVSYRAGAVNGSGVPGQEFGVDLGMVRLDNSKYSLIAAGTGSIASAPTNIIRLDSMNVTSTQTADATFRAIKFDNAAPGANQTARRWDIGNTTITVDTGAILQVGQTMEWLSGAVAGQISGNGTPATQPLNNTQVAGTGTGAVTAGALNVGGQLSFTINAAGNANTMILGTLVKDNGTGPVSLVKSGAGTLSLRNISSTASNYSGGTYVNQGTLQVYRAGNLGASSGGIFLQGGILEFNIPVAGTGAALNSDIALGHNVTINGNSFMGADNNGELADPATTSSTDNNLVFGNLNYNGPHALSLAGFDSYDFHFSGASMFSTSDVSRSAIILAGGRSDTTSVNIIGAITGGGFDINSSGTVTTSPLLRIGGELGTDNSTNTYVGLVRAISGHVLLNKQAGNNTAITGNLDVRGAVVRLDQNEQIANTSNIILNSGGINLNGKNETIGSLEQQGGTFLTGVNSQFNITGNLNLQGSSNPNVFGVNTADGFQINSGSAGTTIVTVAGDTSIGELGKIVLGGSAAELRLNTLNITGGLIQQNTGAGSNIVRLSGDVTATSTTMFPARIGNTGDTDTFVDINGTLLFTVNDGPHGDDLVIASTVRNGPSTGSIYKAGAGTMVLTGASAGLANNTYTGDTTVSAGTLRLQRANGGVGQISVPGNLYVADGNGPATVQVAVSNQIADTSDVTIDSTGVLDLQSFNTDEAVRNLSSVAGGVTKLGPTSALTANITANTTYAGSINGGGSATAAVTKSGAGKWTLSGTSEYSGDTVVSGGTLQVDGFLNGSEINVKSGATLQGIGKVSDVIVESGAFLSPGNSPGVLTTRSVTTMAGSTTNIEIGGLTAGNGATNHDQIISLGTVGIDGTLVISLTGGYVPNQGDTFLIWTNDLADPVTGAFSNFLTNYSTELIASTADPSDFWQIRYDTPSSEIAGASGNDIRLTYVPEPGTSLLALSFGLLALGVRRRQRD